MIQIYLSICHYLSECLAEMQHIDLFNNQYDTSEKEHPFNLPALLVQFMPIVDWTTNADGSQTGMLKMQMHCITTCYSDTANAHKMNDIDKEMSFKHLAFVEHCHIKLQNWAPACCTNLQRTGYFPDQEHGQIYATILEYECHYIDNTTADSVVNETVEITPDLAVNHPIDRPTEPVTTFSNPQQFLL